MWGNHLLDMYQHSNFNVSFPHELTRNPSRLVQWQYWWWFWFSSIFILYYFLVTKVIMKRSLKFRPKIVTSYRAHGRWGDIIVAVVPVFWCFNILSHSTLLLRMSEFQTETNILTIRVRGRQWYWVYKLELYNFFNMSNRKILLNNTKHLNTTSNIRSESVKIFEQHNMYRQYWRNWFLNKNTIFGNFNTISKEMTTPETNYNDIDLDKKSKEWQTKTSRIKSTWFNRSLDSNIVLNQNNKKKINILNKVIKTNCKNEMYNNVHQYMFTNIKQKDNTQNSFLFNSKVISLFKLNNSYNFYKNIFNEKLFSFFINQHNTYNNNLLESNTRLNKTKNTSSEYFSINNFQFFFYTNYNNLFNSTNILTFNYTFNQKNFINFIKICTELFKNKICIYNFTNENITHLFSKKNAYNYVKDSTKYTFELKPKFGYVPTKLNIYTPSLINGCASNDIDILLIQPETEYEFKNLNTVVRYFMVLDQNRKVLNRSIKPTNTTFFNRIEKINYLKDQNTDISNLEFSNFKKLITFLPLIINDREKINDSFGGVNEVYSAFFIKSKNAFISTNSKQNSLKTHDFDYFTPVKYNVTSDLSSTQNNVRTNKKLIYNQRLLHTTSILVLPIKLNITVITNSYDVIHSWFIPGLGLKMDAVPGRSTHHTLFIDHPGLYYGQCAEICGRFHHHMPIKIAALQWEHFILWWYHHTMNLGIHAFLKDINRTSVKEFKNEKVYPITSKFLQKRPAL